MQYSTSLEDLMKCFQNMSNTYTIINNDNLKNFYFFVKWHLFDLM